MSLPPKSATTKLKYQQLLKFPKVSLHDHLDGALRPATIIELAAKAKLAVPVADERGLADWFVESSNSGSLVEYLKTFDLTTAVMQDADSLRRVAKEFVEDAAADGVIYAETRWAPEQHLNGGLSMAEAVAAVQEGIEAGEDSVAQSGRNIRVNQLITAMRHTDRSLEVAKLAVQFRNDGAVGFDIAGPEDGFMPARHREAFDYLAAEFFPVTVHAGEAAGLDSIRSALLDGRALRLGHGVRIAEDLHQVSEKGEDTFVELGELAQWVRDREIALELAPSSNLQTGAIAQWGNVLADHPFDLLYQLGFAVTVNIDNRTLGGADLSRELADLAETFDYTFDDIETFQLNAAAASFLPLEEREELIDQIVSYRQ